MVLLKYVKLTTKFLQLSQMSFEIPEPRNGEYELIAYK